MSDIILLWDCPLLFEKLFLEYGLECTRVLSTALGTPYLPACKTLIIPTGFANLKYTKTGVGLEHKKTIFKKFVENGGVLLVYGPLVPEYNYKWLPFSLKYVMEENSCTPFPIGKNDAQKLVEGLEPPVGCDGYFSKAEASTVLEDDKKRPIIIVKKIGDGMVVATTVHELPSKEFFECSASCARKVKI